MKCFKLKEMTGGWIVGNFEPAILQSREVEVAVKYYNKGDTETWHYHKIATEITVIVSGKVKMNDQLFLQGDAILIQPNEGTNFEVLEDTVTTVVKIPGTLNDKFFDRL